MVATVIAGSLAFGAQPAQAGQAAEPNCWSGRDYTKTWAAYSNCTNRTHRIGISCQTQSRGVVYAWGPWQNPGTRSVGWCPSDTYRINSYGADYPD